MILNTYFSIKETNFVIRPLIYNDYNKNYLFLLQQLTQLDPEQINNDIFNHFVDSLNPKHTVVVVENTDTNKIVGTITSLIEHKIIHNMGFVCHIEDVVVDEKYRGYGLGKLLLESAIQYAKENKCYKTILDCSDNNVGFYEKNGGFEVKGRCMALYH
tara:strand:+ start:178 stop:651 length:474 start_codon:yes stop_codon:yes gene_type:complete